MIIDVFLILIFKKNERWKIVFLSYIILFLEKRGRDGGVYFFLIKFILWCIKDYKLFLGKL